jgi:hypothetical protein
MQNIIVNFVRNSPISCTQTIVSSFKTYKNDDITTLSVQLGAWPQRLVLGPDPRVKKRGFAIAAGPVYIHY